MVKREIVGQFIDAAVNDHDAAQRLLDTYPELRRATWLGDERLLHFLVIENFPPGVSFCLERGFDPDQVDRDTGNTPLHYACQLDYPDVADILLQHGADPNAVSKINDTPIHCAIQNGNAGLVNLLIEHGANPNYTTELGESIFDNWPPWAENDLLAIVTKHNIKRPDGGITNG